MLASRGRTGCPQSTDGRVGMQYSTSGTPAGHREPRLGRIRWMFQYCTTSARSCCTIAMKQYRKQSVSRGCPTWKMPSLTKEANSSIHHCDRLRRKKAHHASIRWLDVDVPNMCARWSWRWLTCRAARMEFSVPQSVLTKHGQERSWLMHSTK